MSGIDEQGVPQCLICKNSHEFRVGSLTWMFPENARIKRGLKYSLFTRRLHNGEPTPMFSLVSIECVACKKKYKNGSAIYMKLNSLFHQYIKNNRCYLNDSDFRKDDKMQFDRGDMNF